MVKPPDRGGSDVRVGYRGSAFIFGGRRADQLVAAGGNDRLIGGDGNDRLSGGAGRDRLGGGKGEKTTPDRSGATGELCSGGGDDVRGAVSGEAAVRAERARTPS